MTPLVATACACLAARTFSTGSAVTAERPCLFRYAEISDCGLASAALADRARITALAYFICFLVPARLRGLDSMQTARHRACAPRTKRLRAFPRGESHVSWRRKCGAEPMSGPQRCGLRLRPALAVPAPGNHREHAGQHRGEAEPGDGILQMVVRQIGLELARSRQAARRKGRFLLDIERRHRAPALLGGDG